MTTSAELVTLVRTKLAEILSSDTPAKWVDYRIGDKSVSKGQYVQHLLDILQKVTSQEATEMGLEIVQFDCDIKLHGGDDTQYTIL